MADGRHRVHGRSRSRRPTSEPLDGRVDIDEVDSPTMGASRPTLGPDDATVDAMQLCPHPPGPAPHRAGSMVASPRGRVWRP